MYAGTHGTLLLCPCPQSLLYPAVKRIPGIYAEEPVNNDITIIIMYMRYGVKRPVISPPPVMEVTGVT